MLFLSIGNIPTRYTSDDTRFCAISFLYIYPSVFESSFVKDLSEPGRIDGCNSLAYRRGHSSSDG